MKQYLLGHLQNFYKANLHCHTTISDGNLSPEQIKKEYRHRGYSVVAYSDHNQYTYQKHLSDDNFLALSALEVDINQTNGNKTCHLNLFDKNPKDYKIVPLPNMPYEDTAAINQYIKDINEAGFLISYNHPYWSMQTCDDYENIENCFAMEIYNHGCELDGLYGYNPQVYDEMLRGGRKLFCLATDDNHNRYSLTSSYCDSFGGFTMIEAPALTYDAVMDSLEAGKFYSSMGPEIKEMYIEDGFLHVKTSPVKKIYVITQTRRCYMSIAENDESLTNAAFKLDGNEGYIRLDCRDEYGRHALSNAYFL